MMTKQTIPYHIERSKKINARIKELLLELPPVCSDYFRSISQTTSALTRLAYAYDLRVFFKFLREEHLELSAKDTRYLSGEDFAALTVKDLERYMEYLTMYTKELPDADANGVADREIIQNGERGIGRKISSVRSFLAYLYRNELIPADPGALVKMPKQHQKPIIFMAEDEIASMLRFAQTGDSLSPMQAAYHQKTQARDFAILMLFLGTGMRVSELIGLNIDDFDFDENACVVHRKGGNETILYYSDDVKEALLLYTESKEDIVPLEGHEKAFFLSSQRRRMSQRAVENLVKKYATMAAPLKKRLSPHKLRSTFGTRLYKETGDIYLVAETLGHSDVNTTKKHYASMSDERKRMAAMRVHIPIEGSTKED